MWWVPLLKAHLLGWRAPGKRAVQMVCGCCSEAGCMEARSFAQHVVEARGTVRGGRERWGVRGKGVEEGSGGQRAGWVGRR